MSKDYKKLYEESIERARDLHDNHALGKPFIYETCEKIFPELRESEDERIRKALIERFKWELKGAEEQDAAGCSRQKDIEMFKQGIAWLEKQEAIDVLDEEEREFVDNVDSYRKEIDAAYQTGYNEGVKVTLEKQGEQKPIWSEEDEEMIRSIRCYLNEFGNWLSDKNEEKSQSIYKACDWLKSIKPHWKPSEEQMNALEYFLKLFGKSDEQIEYTKVFQLVKELLNDLKKSLI